tara:strand:+ start:789 stop:998 length:210 start_codon:yes stop_codon:yes gene_type:complete
MACAAPTTETIYIERDVPPDLLVPCVVSDRQAETWREVAVLATEHLNTAQCANAKIEALAQIFEKGGKA